MPSNELLFTRPGRQRLVTALLNFTRDTSLVPKEQEQQLLEQFVLGEVSIEQVIAELELLAPEKG